MADPSPPTGLPPGVLQQIITQVTNTRTSRTCECELTFSSLLNFELMWFKPMSFMKVLFFLNRYLPLVVFLNQSPSTLTAPVRGHWFKWQIGTALVSLGIIQMILVIRIWAIYNRSKLLLVILGVFGCLQLAASSTIMGISITQGVPSSEPGPGFFVCTITTPPYFAAYWIPILTFEFTLFVLTLIKGVQNFRLAKISPLSGKSGQALLNILVRDSVIYFFIISAVYTANASVWYWADPSLYQSSSVFGINVPPMVTCKLLFSLRYTAQKETTLGSAEHELTVFRARVPTLSSGLQTHNTSVEDQGQWGEWGRRAVVAKQI
ncbi:hypothetical protein R3P38DRAFT_2833970 [Favolaschia claudopus]|uniref:DUF6533 domain-containing protein n=1 Tax=Favolaschia claudopus TaxID=2862362 RepID=A0AAW0EFP4_9AGAR